MTLYNIIAEARRGALVPANGRCERLHQPICIAIYSLRAASAGSESKDDSTTVIALVVLVLMIFVANWLEADIIAALYSTSVARSNIKKHKRSTKI